MVAFGVTGGARGGIEFGSSGAAVELELLYVLTEVLGAAPAPADAEPIPLLGVVEFAVLVPENGSNFAMPSFIRS